LESISIPKLVLLGPKRSGKSSIRHIVFERGNPNEAFLIEQNTVPISRIYPFEGDPMQFEVIDCPGSTDYLEDLNSVLQTKDAEGNVISGLFSPSGASASGTGGAAAGGATSGPGVGSNGGNSGASGSGVTPGAGAAGIGASSATGAGSGAGAAAGAGSATGLNAAGLIHEPLGLVLVLDAQDEENFRDACESFIATAVAARKVAVDVSCSVLVHKMDADSGLADESRQDNLSQIRTMIHEGMQREGLPQVPVLATSIFDHTIFDALSRILQRLLPHVSELEKLLNNFLTSCSLNKAVIFDIFSKLYFASDRSPMDVHVYTLCTDLIEVVLDMSSIYDPRCRTDEEKVERVFAGMDQDAKSVIRLSNQFVLYFRHISHGLVLLCLLNKESYTQPGLMEQNFATLRANILNVFGTASKNV